MVPDKTLEGSSSNTKLHEKKEGDMLIMERGILAKAGYLVTVVARTVPTT